MRDVIKPSGEIDSVALIKGLLRLRNTADQDTRLSPAQMLLGRKLRDFLPQKKGLAIKSYKDMRDKWQDVAEWREIALAPRQEKMHDR